MKIRKTKRVNQFQVMLQRFEKRIAMHEATMKEVENNLQKIIDRTRPTA